MDRSMKLISPTYPNQYGSTALVPSDFSASLCKSLAPYNTIGNQNFFWRASYDASSVIQQGTSLDTSVSYSFNLSNFPGYNDFVSTFDEYRLHALSVCISPNYTNFPANALNPRLWTVIDYDDAATVSRASAEAYDTCVISPPGCGVIRVIKPRIAMAAYTGTFTGYVNMAEQWIDLNSTSVQHYGLKLVVEGGSGATPPLLQTYTVTVTGFWEFRATR